MSSRRIWGPIILQAAESFVRHRIKPSDQGVVETYWDIVFAAGHRYAVPSFTERADEGLDQIACELSQILLTGRLGGYGSDSPQAVFTESNRMRPIAVKNPASHIYGDKPEGAFWTSSYLPDGSSAWARSEDSEFSGRNRRLRSFTFESSGRDAVYLIRTPEDYRQLVIAYPREPENGLLSVDWPRVSSDYAAVRLTAAGLAVAQNYRVTTPDGVAQLAGWDAESTAWLNLPRDAHLTD